MNNYTTTEINNSKEAVHVSKITDREYQIGSLICPNTGKLFDITVITDYHNDIEDSEFEIVNFYFGDYDYDTTEQYIAATKSEVTHTLLLAILKDDLRILKEVQRLDMHTPVWSKYCENAQHIDPNGDWTNVEQTPDNLEALINFYTNQIEEIEGTPIEEEEASQNMPCDTTGLCDTTCSKYFTDCHNTGSIIKDLDKLTEDMPTKLTLSIEDIINAGPNDDFIFDDETVELRVLRDTSNTGGYDILSMEVLAQNVAGCINAESTVHIPVVEISNAQLTLIQIAMEFGIKHVRQMYAEIGDDISTENVDCYNEELKSIVKCIEEANNVDDFDIQIRN